jgi:hypothetical protein
VAWTRVQASGKLNDPTTSGARTFNAWPGATNFLIGNYVFVVIVHYVTGATAISGVTINGDAATRVVQRQHATNVPNRVEIWYRQVATGSARNVVVTPGGGADNYYTLAILEYSQNGTFSVVANTPTGTDGSTNQPTSTLQSDVAAGDLTLQAFVNTVGGNITHTPPTGTGYTTEFNEPDGDNQEGGGAVSRILQAGGVQSITWGTSSTSFAWSAVSATFRSTGGSGYSMTAVAGTYAVTGRVANLLRGLKMPAVAGALALTGRVANLVKSGNTMTAVAGALALTGRAAGLYRNLRLNRKQIHTHVVGDSMAGQSGITAGEMFYVQYGNGRPAGDTVTNRSDGGAWLEHVTSDWTARVQNFYDATRLNVLITWNLIHGNVQDSSDTLDQILGRIALIKSTANSNGWLYFCTTVPGTDEFPALRGRREALNRAIRFGNATYKPSDLYDGLIDVERLPGFREEDMTGSGTSMISGDGIHPTAAGQAAAASLALIRVGNALLGHYTMFGNTVAFASGRGLLAAAGSLALTGRVATLTAQRKIVAVAGSLAITGRVANLLRGYRMTAVAGSLALTGRAAGLVRALRMSATTGVHAVSGRAAGLLRGLRMVADAGALALTGRDVVFPSAGVMQAVAGSYQVTGRNVSPIAARKLTAAPGALALTGNANAFSRDKTLAADAGALVLTGRAAALVATHRMTAVPGALALTGNAAGIGRGPVMPAVAGSIVLTGRAATLTRGVRVVAVAGSYGVVGNASALRAAKTMAAASGAFALAGGAALFAKGRAVVVDAGGYALTGSAIATSTTRRLVALSGVLALTGRNALLLSSSNTIPPGTPVFGTWSASLLPSARWVP